jgi:hypothetical protein
MIISGHANLVFMRTAASGLFLVNLGMTSDVADFVSCPLLVKRIAKISGPIYSRTFRFRSLLVIRMFKPTALHTPMKCAKKR